MAKTSTQNKNCSHCGSKWKKAHKPNCSRPNARRAPKAPVPVPHHVQATMNFPTHTQTCGPVSTQTALTQSFVKRMPGTPANPPAVAKKLVNRVVWILDDSGSMAGLREKALQYIERDMLDFKAAAKTNDQPTYMSVYQFSDNVVKLMDQVYFEAASMPATNNTSGMTALYDAIGMAIQDINRQADINDSNVSVLIKIITDGQENASHHFKRDQLIAMIKAGHDTGRWSIGYSGPLGCRAYAAGLGIPDGNILEWEQTVAGVGIMAAANYSATQSYMSTRSAGGTAISGMYSTDLSKVNANTLNQMTDLSSEFHCWTVDKGEVEISDFVNSKLNANSVLSKKVGGVIQLGRAYYQLTKTEKVQAAKDMLLLNKATGRIYGGAQARTLIGLPANVDIKVTPGNHANFDVFVRSTSTNRKLVRGTKLLYRTGAV